MSLASHSFTATIYPVSPRERDRWILALRPARTVVDVRRPHACLIERERAANGEIVDIATLFLTGRECPWRCLMCDLWKNTTAERTPVGAIPAQIDFALTELGRSRGEVALTSHETRTASEGLIRPSLNATDQVDVPFPLTPALSLGERERGRPAVEPSSGTDTLSAAGGVPPLLGKRAGVRGKDAHEHPDGCAPSSPSTRPPRHIKLYNSGSFFDRAAVPFEDYEPIARRVAGFERVIVESHPALIGDATLRFRDLLNEMAVQGPSAVRQVLECGGAPPLAERDRACGTPAKRQSTGAAQNAAAHQHSPKLEVAMGLETAHPEVLERLNKRFTLADFARAASFQSRAGIALRVFVLVKPPFMDEGEALDWAVRSTQFAFDCGAGVVSLIPTRSGNGALEALAARGQFAPPRLATLESALEQSLALGRGRVFADLWDLEKFSACPACFGARRARLQRMNLQQQSLPLIRCEHCS